MNIVKKNLAYSISDSAYTKQPQLRWTKSRGKRKGHKKRDKKIKVGLFQERVRALTKQDQSLKHQTEKGRKFDVQEHFRHLNHTEIPTYLDQDDNKEKIR